MQGCVTIAEAFEQSFHGPFKFLSNSPPRGAQISLDVTVGILTCFISELTLRQIAKGYRFFKDIWNIFDFVVGIPCAALVATADVPPLFGIFVCREQEVG